ncbi:ABC transporter permease [Marispirochaeta aestuarii]|uniref:ABC transporter permease n=1 Tax=Marispirochaeta aestuarii TaxID=1963862 RepID=A0A1Y1RV45_9SPIO|nr:TRAP transporter large permease [Marispirochaeta aestuarii]ORC31188.1 ABC transporter permease [Marispirochaeta aestuarii]
MIFFITFGLIGLLALGVPVAFALGGSALFGYLYNAGPNAVLSVISRRMMFGLNNFLLLAIPLFILSAKIMNSSKITSKIFGFAHSVVGFLPGGLGHANVVASLIFAGMSGAAVVDAAGLGQIELEAMEDGGYDKDFSVAITAASSTIGPIFPPSLPMVVFGFMSGVSVGRLFLGGVVPGLIMTAILMLLVSWYAHRRGYPRLGLLSVKGLAKSLMDAILPLLTPVILLGGIWSGAFTPTEAAAIAVLYALVIGKIALKELGFKEIKQVFIDTARETAVIGIIVAASGFYGWILMRSGLTVRIANSLMTLSDNPLIIFLVVNLFLLVIGCFLDPTVAILILTPILMPVIQRVGIDPVHFGVVMVLNLMIGLLTPPFGIVLFVMQQVSGLSYGRVVKATAPFLLPLFIVLVLIVIFPDLVIGLPNLLYAGR